MWALRSILCPVDFSEESQNALRWAVALAAKHQSRLTVLNVVDQLLVRAAQARYGRDLPKAETEPALRSFVTAALPPAAAWVPTPLIDARVGDPSNVILETADREHVDLIVMGTHGLGGLRKLFLGSTTERVLRRTRVPLLAVPSAGLSVVLDASGPRFTIKSILAATDFSEASSNAVQLAAELAREFSGPLVITHVVTPVIVPTQWQPYIEFADEERVTQARERLETWLRELPGKIQGEIIVSVGRPADSIAATAAEKGAGLIVMGLFGDRGASAPRPGSIAYRVLCASHVPVLVIASRTSAAIDSRTTG
jgi:nucleotide-binding universal stress UspA family protein